MMDRVPPADLPQGAHVTVLIGWCAMRMRYGSWRLLDVRDEGVYWIRGWHVHNSKIVRALKTAAALARAQQA